MKPRTSPVVLGFIWGILTMMLSFAVFSVFASLKLVFTGFPLFADSEQTQYLLIGAVFLLSVLGAVGAGIMPRLMRLGGLFLLLSCIGVAALLFAPFIMQSFSFSPLEAYGIYLPPIVLLIADFSLGALTAIGFLGGILAFIPKKDRKASVSENTTVPTVAPVISSPELAHATPPTAALVIPQAEAIQTAPDDAPVAAAPEVPAAPVETPVTAQPQAIQSAPADVSSAEGAVSASPIQDIDLMNMD
jgi:hypothetical protein